MRRLLVDLTPVRVSIPFRRLWIGTATANVGTQLTTVAVGLQVYEITRSTFAVGLVGLFAAVPIILLGLYGGAIVDAYDRRRVVLITAIGLLLVAAGFTTQAWLEVGNVWLLYALVAIQGGLFSVNAPARVAIIPRLVPTNLLAAANALTSFSRSIGKAAGPLMAGIVIGWQGYGWAYSIEVVLSVIAVVTLFALPPMPPEGRAPRVGLRSVLEGLSYLRHRPNLRTTFMVDLSAMVLAMPRALFPAIGAAILGGGATTVGILAAAVAAGAFLAGLLSGPLGHIRRQGLAVVVSVVGWGLAIVTFGTIAMLAPGASPGDPAHWLLWPAVACMVWAGAADTISAVLRLTILQAATPDALRGRLQGVYSVVVAGGPRLGDLTLGTTAEATTEGIAAVAGGAACVVLVCAIAAKQRGFIRYDARHPTA